MGMNQQDHYLPMFRLRHQTSGGFSIDPETEKIMAQGNSSTLMKRVEHGFTYSRQKINSDKQEPIMLDIMQAWYLGMVQQETNAALGRYAADLLGAMTQKGGEFGSVQEMIKSRVGMSAWNILRNIYNNSISDKGELENFAYNKLANFLIRNRSYAYVAFSPVTALKQTGSYFLAIPHKHHGHIYRTLWKALDMGLHGQANQFLEETYQLYPELRFAGGDPFIASIRQEQQFNPEHAARNAVSRFSQKYAYAATGFLDKMTKAIVFQSAYQGFIENGIEQQQAITQAIRVVTDIQPASSSREMTDFNRPHGAIKLMFTQFMNSLAPVFNVGVVDVARNIAAKDWNHIKAAAWSLMCVGLGLAYTGFINDALTGKLPTGQELPNGRDDDWPKWTVDTLFENFINAIPILNGLTSVYRLYSGKKQYRSSTNRFLEPVEYLHSAARKLFNDNDDDNGKGFDDAVRGLALFTGRIPYSGLTQILRWFGLYDRKE